MFPTEILNVALVAFAGTVTVVATTNRACALLDRVTTAPLAGAAFDRLTVQLLLPLDAKVVTAQVRAEIVAGAAAPCSETVVEADVPFNDPVSVAV
jgi:hypothetical protein